MATSDVIGPDDMSQTWSRLQREHLDMHTALKEVEELQDDRSKDVDDVLAELNRISMASVPGAQYAGITLIDERGEIHSLAPTDDYPRLLDDVQRDVLEGPCLSAAWNQHTIHVDDLTVEDRWPRYRDAVLELTPIRSVLSFRLFGNDKRLAALNFYADTAGIFDDESIEIGLIFASHTSATWRAMNREEQFRSALASRDIIGQAKGILMERFNIDAVAAFTMLRRLSQETNAKVVDLAERLVTADHPTV